MIYTIACNARDCPWRRIQTKGCAHPDGVGKVETRKSLEAAVPSNCPIRKSPDVLVAPPPAGGLMSPLVHVNRVVEQITTALARWAEMARTVHSGKKGS